MEIRKKLTLQFTATVAILLLASFMIIYITFSSFRSEEFKSRLSNKAKSIAQLIAETENIDSDLLKRIEKNNPTSLPKEKILVYNNKNQIIFSSGENDHEKIPKTLLDEIRNKTSIHSRNISVEVFGYFYKGSKESVVVICSAIDVFGLRKLKSLGISITSVFFLSLIILYFLGRFFASKALSPISDVIEQVSAIDISNINTKVIAGNETDEIALLAETFNQMLERLEVAFKTQKDFIANASHELRTPLTSITGQLEVTLLQERTSTEYRKTLKSVLEDINSLNNLTHRLLALLRADIVISDSEFDTLRIDDILWIARSEILKRSKNNVIEISFDSSIKGEHHFQYKGNEELLKIAFKNIMDNSCKYSPNHKCIIILTVEENYLNIQFLDNGIGIPEKEIELISNPFYRASNAMNVKGHGIGFSLVEKIITLHKGELQLTSIINKGTKVCVLLPLSTNF